jgi:hypothetical protein
MNAKESESLLESIAAFKQYRKRPVQVRAARIIQAVDIQTLEGTVRGYPGDYLVVGMKGEVFPCRADIFNATYDEVQEKP